MNMDYILENINVLNKEFHIFIKGLLYTVIKLVNVHWLSSVICVNFSISIKLKEILGLDFKSIHTVAPLFGYRRIYLSAYTSNARKLGC